MKRRLNNVVTVLMCCSVSCCLSASVGPVHRINPQLTKPAWITVLEQGMFLDEVTAQPLLNSDAVNSLITINHPGRYQLVQDLVYPIFIGVSDVSVDLGSHAVVRSSLTDNIITVSASVSNVSIFNGYLKSTYLLGAADNVITGGSGVYVNAGCSNIALSDLIIIGCAYGIRCVGLGGSLVSDCEFAHLKMLSNAIGILLSYTYATVMRSCSVLYALQTGFTLNNCQTNCLEDCYSLKLTSTTTAIAFQSTQGTSNMFQRCVAKQTKTSSTTFGEKAYGFLLTGTEQKTKIVDCIVNQTDVVSSPTAVTCGVQLAPVIQPTADLLSTVTYWSGTGLNEPYTMSWSPNNEYLAVALRAACLVSIYGFNGTGLTLVTSVTPVATSQNPTVTWSPDGKYLAVGINYDSASTLTNVKVYSFNGQTLTLAASYAGGAASTNSKTFSLAWSPNGKYICYTNCSSGVIGLLSFDSSSLSLVDSQAYSVTAGSGYYMTWAPDASAVAIAADTTNLPLTVIPVNASGKMGTAVQLVTSLKCSALRWSPNGKYIAFADNTNSTLQIYRWLPTDTSPLALACPALSGEGVSGYSALAWSPDGNYFVAGAGNSTVRLYQFNGTSLTFQGASRTLTAVVKSVAWSADGRYIAAPGSAVSTGSMAVLTAMYGPLNCLVDNCRVNDTLASGSNMGLGIVMGGSNVCTRTVACNNGINYSYGIPNVYDGRFEIARNVVQPFDNISLPTTL